MNVLVAMHGRRIGTIPDHGICDKLSTFDLEIDDMFSQKLRVEAFD